MIQDIDAIYHNEYRQAVPQPEDYIMYVQKRTVLMKKNSEEIQYLTRRQVENSTDAADFIYLFSLDMAGGRRQFFLGNADTLDPLLLEEYQYESHNIFRTKKPKTLAFAGITAVQLGNWYDATRFCGHCATALIHHSHERMMLCPACHAMHYPKISPAVIVAVTKEDKLLMTKYADRDYKKYALIAGFTEIGETIEETVSREVYEEVGLHVKNIRYYKSQPWSFSDTLLMGFFCEAEGDEPIRMDEKELSVAEWIPRAEIEAEFDDISLTNEMMVLFKENEEF